MRIIIAGDRFWSCRELAESTLRRLIVRHGPDIVIVHGGAPAVDHSFAEACRALGVKADLCLADFSHLGDHRFSNRQMILKGARLCLIFHHSVLDDGSSDLARQAIAAGVPTYLIDSEEGRPRRFQMPDTSAENGGRDGLDATNAEV
jgi:hypothetical protein